MADSSSLTLSDYALFSNDPLIRKISLSMLKLGNVLQDLPLMTKKSMVVQGTRFIGTAGNATVGWRQINEDPAVTKGQPKAFGAQAYIMSNNFDSDVIFQQDENAIGNVLNAQIQHYLEMVTYTFNDVFINNNHITGDSDAPVGIRYRLDNASDYDIPTELKVDASVDISSATNGLALLEKIDLLFYAMGAPEGDGIVLYSNETLRARLDRTIRAAGTSGGFSVAQDQFGRSIMKYKNATFRTIGRKSNQSTQIITNTEDTAGANASSTYTSIYAVRFGEPYFYGWQFRSLEQAFSAPFRLQNGVQDRINFDWPVGMVGEHTRSIGRLYDIKIS